MISRGMVIAALFVVELAILSEAVIAIRGGVGPMPGPFADMQGPSGDRLAEGGPHQTFDVGAHPALTVDIGYADLTILTTQRSRVDVSVSGSRAFGIFRAKTPLTAREDGDTVRIAASDTGKWSMGDDRMVTVLVPPETQVTVINAGDIKANGLRGEASFNSIGNGSLTVDDFDGPALHVASADGPIVLREIVAPRLEATSSDDHIDATSLQVRDGTVESDGPVTLGFASGTDATVNAETSNGRIRVSGFNADTAAAHKGSDDDAWSQTLRVGAGTGHLDVHSNDGDIRLAQEG